MAILNKVAPKTKQIKLVKWFNQSKLSSFAQLKISIHSSWLVSQLYFSIAFASSILWIFEMLPLHKLKKLVREKYTTWINPSWLSKFRNFRWEQPATTAIAKDSFKQWKPFANFYPNSIRRSTRSSRVEYCRCSWSVWNATTTGSCNFRRHGLSLTLHRGHPNRQT